MKKLFLIRYTWNNKDKDWEAKHYEDVYYLCRNISEALIDIQSKFTDGIEVKITQFEEVFYKEV